MNGQFIIIVWLSEIICKFKRMQKQCKTKQKIRNSLDNIMKTAHASKMTVFTTCKKNKINIQQGLIIFTR